MPLKRSMSDSALCFTREALRFKMHRETEKIIKLERDYELNHRKNQFCITQQNSSESLMQRKPTKRTATTAVTSNTHAKLAKNEPVDVYLIESPPLSPSSMTSNNLNKEKKSLKSNMEMEQSNTKESNIQNIKKKICELHGVKRSTVSLKRIEPNESVKFEKLEFTENVPKKNPRGRPKLYDQAEKTKKATTSKPKTKQERKKKTKSK